MQSTLASTGWTSCSGACCAAACAARAHLGLRLHHAVPLAQLAPGIRGEVLPPEGLQVCDLQAMLLAELCIAGANDLRGVGELGRRGSLR